MDKSQAVRLKAFIRISGVVQGVGFRPFVARLAAENRIFGSVRNESGHVCIEAIGYESDLSRFIDQILRQPPVGSRISRLQKRVTELSQTDEPLHDFIIQKSGEGAGGTVMPTPDIAICEDCRKELFTPGDPRFENPFISCTNCGPRFSILRRLPYDRVNTAMDGFPLCALCAFQYGDVSDRRCHAQTVCCNNCGPVLTYRDKSTSFAAKEALNAAVQALKRRELVAIKGIGGYHLACDPFDDEAVSALRTLKGREYKPFAILFSSIEDVKEHCIVSSSEAAMLEGPERPIILLQRKDTSDISKAVYTSSPYLGVFLAYTPLQYLILRQTGPLVMTSANRTGLPIIKDDDEMLRFLHVHEELYGVLLHNRGILRRADDSVAAVVCGNTQMMRRARGYVPLPLSFSKKGGPALLACGAQQKNTICLSRGEFFYPSAEIGDLDTKELVDVYHETVSDMQEMLGIVPELLVCDAHPYYESTRYAQSTGLPILKVQHHFAHIASVMAEEGITRPVIGVAFDGTGYGTDGTVWGGEFLIASPTDFIRAGHIKSIRFIGSDESVLQGWKSAACVLHDAGILSTASDSRYALIKAALDLQVNTIRSSSMGRVFDAVSSILGICHESTYEGQCAIELENAAAHFAGRAQEEPFPFLLTNEKSEIVADLSPCIRTLCEYHEKGMDAGRLAYRFHLTICRLIVDVCIKLRDQSGIQTVALSGGVFQNRILLSAVVPGLKQEGFSVYTNRQVPAGDGGISLGQAYIGRWANCTKEEKQPCVLPFRENS